MQQNNSNSINIILDEGNEYGSSKSNTGSNEY